MRVDLCEKGQGGRDRGHAVIYCRQIRKGQDETPPSEKAKNRAESDGG